MQGLDPFLQEGQEGAARVAANCCARSSAVAQSRSERVESAWIVPLTRRRRSVRWVEVQGAYGGHADLRVACIAERRVGSPIATDLVRVRPVRAVVLLVQHAISVPVGSNQGKGIDEGDLHNWIGSTAVPRGHDADEPAIANDRTARVAVTSIRAERI